MDEVFEEKQKREQEEEEITREKKLGEELIHGDGCIKVRGDSPSFLSTTLRLNEGLIVVIRRGIVVFYTFKSVPFCFNSTSGKE